jgi:hypothetical protein
MPKNEAIKKRSALSNKLIAAIMIRGPGINSAIVGTIFLKIEEGVAIKPWGIISRIRCASNEPPDIANIFCELSIPD